MWIPPSNTPSPEGNPTLVILDNLAKDGSGIGITAENDFARLIVSFKSTALDTEIYAYNFALAPKCSLALHFSVNSVGGFASLNTFSSIYCL